MAEGLQRAVAATHGLVLGGTYRTRGGNGPGPGRTRVLVEVRQTRRGEYRAVVLHPSGSGLTKEIKLQTFAKWAKGADLVTNPAAGD